VARAEGFEPPSLCLEDKSTIRRKILRLNGWSDNKAFSSQKSMCAAVSGYVRLIIGSLQKSLQCVAPPSDAVLRQSTSIIAEQVDRFFVRNCFVTAQSLGLTFPDLRPAGGGPAMFASARTLTTQQSFGFGVINLNERGEWEQNPRRTYPDKSISKHFCEEAAQPFEILRYTLWP
jgi:hypothetical protein